MKIFISHAEINYDLAKMLKQILEASQNIDEAFIFEEKKKLGKSIDKKITDEIILSDYLVAIITNDAVASASVNQELGYAQALGIERIPMIQKNSAQGVLIYGDEKPMFSNKDEFIVQCHEVCEYIVKNGPRAKITKEEIDLIQKSAHYRKALERSISLFLDSVYYRINVGGNKLPGLVSHGDPELTKAYTQKIKNFFEDEKMIQSLSNIDFIMYRKLDSDLMLCKNEINNAERFPHNELPQKEADLIVKLKEELMNMNQNDLDVGQYCKDIFDPNLTFDFNTCDQMMKLDHYKHEIKQHLKWVFYDMIKITSAMIGLTELFLEYREKFGDMAFKNP